MPTLPILVASVPFLSTPSARRATVHRCPQCPPPPISIHALREEGDSSRNVTKFVYPGISIHALREEGDRSRLGFCCWQSISIHALREEGDCRQYSRNARSRYFYPRPPRGGRHFCTQWVYNKDSISIHALREEGDSKNGEKHLRFCFIIKRSAQIWKSLSKNIRKNSCDLHRTA